jgi:MFS family permease
VAIKRLDAARLVSFSMAAFGLLSLITWNAPAISTSFGVYVGIFVAVGVPGLAATTGLLTLLQAHAPEAARGRVMSTFFAVYGGVQAVGMLLAGLLGTGTGLTVGLQMQGVLYLVGAVLARRLIARPADRVPSTAWTTTSVSTTSTAASR